MTVAWAVILALAVSTVAIKSIGPLALGGRRLPPRMAGVVGRLAPSLLAALVVVDTFGRPDHTLGIDETAAGLLAAAAALALRLPMYAVVVIAAAATAAARAVA